MPARNKYTPEMVASICDLLAKGNTRHVAASLSGISDVTFHHWLNTKPNFVKMVERAESECEEKMVEVIRTSAFEREVVITKVKVVETAQGTPMTITETTTRKEVDAKTALDWLKLRRWRDWRDRQDINVNDQRAVADEITEIARKVASEHTSGYIDDDAE